MVGLLPIVVVLSCVYMVECTRPKYEHTDDGKVKIKLKSAELNEEETHSPHMPSTLKCDACIIIAYEVCRAYMGRVFTP